MEFSELLSKRRSCKKYLDKQVPLDLIGALVEAGGLAPSAGNKQNWKFIVVRDREKRDQIAKFSKDQYWMAEAPVHIVICSDNNITDRLYGSKSEKYSIQNCALAAENILFAAINFGLGAAFVAGFDEEEIANLLGVPGSSKVQSVITVGYPAQKEISKKTLKPIKEILNIEAYGSDGKDLSAFMFDWSTVIKKQITGLTDDVVDIMKSELTETKKGLTANLDKTSKKIKKYLERRFTKRQF